MFYNCVYQLKKYIFYLSTTYFESANYLKKKRSTSYNFHIRNNDLIYIFNAFVLIVSFTFSKIIIFIRIKHETIRKANYNARVFIKQSVVIKEKDAGQMSN